MPWPFSSGKQPDRVETNESDGKTFYGYDDKSTGKTDWYNEKGELDSTSKTPYKKH